MGQDNYWTRARSGRVSRRRFVGGATMAGVGAAAFGLVGCGDDDDDGGDETATAATGTATSTGTGTGTATATATGTASNQPVAGGVAKLVSANNTWDTFDIDRSRFSPVAWLYGYSGLGVLHYKSFTDLELEGGFAESWEQTDDLTTTFKMRNNVFFHNKPPVNGRQAVAQDLVAFMERNRAGKLIDGTDDPNFYRKALYAQVDTITAPDESTVVVKTKAPHPFLIDTLASSYAKVAAPEAVEAFEADWSTLTADKVIGAGGFVLDEFAAEGTSRWSRHDKFHEEVHLDGIQWLPLFTDQAAQEAAFIQKQLDAFAPTQNAVIEDLNERFDGEILEQRYFAANPQAGTYYGGAEPWSNKNLIGGIFRAMDRRALIQSILQGKGALSGNVPPAQAAYTLTEQELVTLPGYLTDRAKDEAEAKAMWDAGGGPALGNIIVDIPDIWEGLYSGGSALIKAQLEKVLGNTVEIKIEPYSTITGKLIEQKYGNGTPNIWFGWISDLTGPDPTVLNYLSYNSTSPQNFQFAVKVDEVDALTGKAMVEFDEAERQTISKDFVRLAAENWGMGIPYSLSQIVTVLSWNYYHYREVAPFVNQHQAATGTWIDPEDPTYEGRPA